MPLPPEKTVRGKLGHYPKFDATLRQAVAEVVCRQSEAGLLGSQGDSLRPTPQGPGRLSSLPRRLLQAGASREIFAAGVRGTHPGKVPRTVASGHRTVA
jgi:hypothetical protein